MSLWQVIEIATFSKSHERKPRKVDRFWRWSVYMSRVFLCVCVCVPAYQPDHSVFLDIFLCNVSV